MTKRKNEKIIKRLRKIKKNLLKIYKNEVWYIDTKGEIIADTEQLNKLLIISKIDEEIDNIIYQIIDKENY